MPSEKILQQKQEQVAKLTEAFKAANVGVLVNYSGITVEKDTKLRKQLREAGCEYKVVKNTLLARAFAEAGIEGLEEQLNGTTAIAYSSNGYTEAPKILSDYAKDNETFQVKAGFIDGSAVDAKSIDELAKLPSKEVLLAQVLGGPERPHPGLRQRAQRHHPRPGHRPERYCRKAERLRRWGEFPRNHFILPTTTVTEVFYHV